MNVGELKRIIANMPDELPVVVDGPDGWEISSSARRTTLPWDAGHAISPHYREVKHLPRIDVLLIPILPVP